MRAQQVVGFGMKRCPEILDQKRVSLSSSHDDDDDNDDNDDHDDDDDDDV